MFLKKLKENPFQIPVYLENGTIYSLNELRAVSILIVILGHFRLTKNLPRPVYQFLDTVFAGGELGVRFFFVISGFLITSLLIKEQIKTGNINLKKFYIR